MKDVLKELIIRFQENGIPEDFIERNVQLAPFLESKNALVISGPRRAGKTYLMFQIMKTLNVPFQNYVYLNFEDNVLIDFTPKNFEDILNAFKELYPGKKPVLFLDEIHRIPQWELFVRKLVDTKHQVFVTGSNAQLLSKEYATQLGGRYLELQVFPLSFKEFLQFKNFQYDRNILYSDQRFQLLALFEEYVEFGGFPEVVLAQNVLLKDKLIDSYFKTAFFRDVVDRYKVKDETMFEVVLKKTAENVGQPFSFRSIQNKIQALGYQVSIKTIVKYFDYATKSFLLLPSYFQRESVAKREKERKFYFIDNGYLKTFFISKNLSKKLENAVAVNLVAKGKRLQYFRNTLEIDFILDDFTPVQVAYQITSPETQKREVESLIKYLNYVNQNQGYLLTWNETATIEQDSKTIKVLPVWYFLLNLDH